MENSYNNRDFEHFVKQNADQYRMFPSEKVWNNIHHTIHPRNRWYGIGLSLLLLTIATVTGVMLVPSNRNQQIADRLPNASASMKLPESPGEPVASFSPVINKQLSQPVQPSTTEEINNRNLFMSDMSVTEPEEVPDVIAKSLAPPAISIIRPFVAAATVAPAIVPSNTNPATVTIIRKTEIPSEPLLLVEENAGVIIPVTDESRPAEIVASETKADKNLEANTENLVRSDYPLTIESVLNLYSRKKNKVTLEAYFTPTVSYRSLKEDNSFLSQAQSRQAATTTPVTVSDIENIVTHKPDYGLQLGVNAGYNLSPRIRFISGLQFNVNKYDIRAYNYPAERTTIALMSGPVRAYSVEAETTYRNYSGSRKADWLHNLYFSASLPIGLQVRLSRAGRSEIGVGGSIQPTYILGNRSYLLSTDYKNYAEVPSLIRKWNMSSSFEAYAGLRTGKVDWKIGPQVRYQLFSSYKQEYPVKEHLFDFGLKVGIMLNK